MLRNSLSPGQAWRKKLKVIQGSPTRFARSSCHYMMPVTSKDILGSDGPLAERLDGFTPRPAQQEMAARIEQALADYSVFIAESGTGTGKTFAYLVPALLSGKKILISTGTRHLQDQL